MLLKDYLRIRGMTMEDLRDELEPEVEASLRRSLVLGEIVEQEDLGVTDDALDVRIAESSEQYGEKAEEVRAALSTPESRRGLRNRMLANKAVERLVSIAKGEVPEGSDVLTEEADEEVREEEESEA
jgi:FKBP-type peptidyl-prolyl cis-trans isomerase (trigger factor)